jgi:hypothetical protein
MLWRVLRKSIKSKSGDTGLKCGGLSRVRLCLRKSSGKLGGGEE